MFMFDAQNTPQMLPVIYFTHRNNKYFLIRCLQKNLFLLCAAKKGYVNYCLLFVRRYLIYVLMCN